MRIDINNAVFNLKRIQNPEDYFPGYVNEYLKSYIDFLKKNKIDTDIINLVKDFAKNIYTCLIEYYSGQHDNAKYYFNQAINLVKCEEIYKTLDKDIFYRAREPSKSCLIPELCLSKDEMFHIPFEKRYKVSTKRYSYPGYPCLYLGSSYEVCCDELNDWNDNLNIACIEKCGLDKMAILDLHFFEEFDFDTISEEDSIKFIKFWPLVACCSFVYENPDDMIFRPDYIFPQLLLEYIIDKNTDMTIKGFEQTVCGIKYYSVKKAFFQNSDKNSTASYNNYVFPVQSNKTTGHCDYLKKHFEVKWVCFLKELNKKSTIVTTA